MKPIKVEQQHTGAERFEVALEYTLKEVVRIGEMTPAGKIVPRRIELVWERPIGGEWRRVVGRGGSKAWGNVKIEGVCGSVGPYRSREIFSKNLRNILPWAEYLMPGLRQAIADVESELPE